MLRKRNSPFAWNRHLFLIGFVAGEMQECTLDRSSQDTHHSPTHSHTYLASPITLADVVRCF